MNDISTFKTTLDGRILCGDGDSIVELPFLYGHILSGKSTSNLFVSKTDFNSDEVQFHNIKFPNDKIEYKKEMKDLSFKWTIPRKFKELDVSHFLKKMLKAEFKDSNLDNQEKKQRVLRVKMEIRIWKKRNLVDLLRTLIFIVNTFEENKIIWGTGRGSSCASYILYLIGLHQVDSVLYELDIGDFFR